ncbi:XkdW family protein [Bacillus vallismortis]|uniref:XkdW family protein n=1 Tax=Bacillus vallismortis TaxID=72361 RepID=UPI00227E06DE|nr:XkdW family protein [Bacillus vallismortis]MCY7895085.1 XkdW family protein [Bacillus vallismortis]MCY7919386.1 XkdW family protein [Bacillus vallismortis]MEC1652067.1 XkdW family protein [Bacillus vallismortis]
MILYDAIIYKYPNAVPRKDFELRNDGNGSYIEKWNLRAPLPTQEELQAWWEESKSNPPYEPPDQVELLAQELSQEKLARKQLEELNQTLGNALSEIKLQLLSLQGENNV